jgi:hypothetical protein
VLYCWVVVWVGGGETCSMAVTESVDEPGDAMLWWWVVVLVELRLELELWWGRGKLELA